MEIPRRCGQGHNALYSRLGSVVKWLSGLRRLNDYNVGASLTGKVDHWQGKNEDTVGIRTLPNEKF